MPINTTIFFPELQEYLHQIPQVEVPEDRMPELERLAEYLAGKLKSTGSAALNFICTHNSRRSHMGQVWAQTLAVAYGLDGISTYSGGTEATAANPRTIRALRQAGFNISQLDESPNPHYRIAYGSDHEGMEAWSKVYSDPANPQQEFGAIMTCDSANEACPVVLGADGRFPIMYLDPKAFDDTPREQAAYAERCQQIAAEMNWVMSRTAELLIA